MSKKVSSVIENGGARHTLSVMLLYKWRHRSIIIAIIRHINVKVTLCKRHSAKGLSKTFDNSVVAMVTDLWRHWCRSMADSMKSFTFGGVYHAPPNFRRLSKLKFFQQRLKFFSNK